MYQLRCGRSLHPCEPPLEAGIGHVLVVILVVLAVLGIAMLIMYWVSGRGANALPLSSERLESEENLDRIRTGALWGDLNWIQYSPTRKLSSKRTPGS